MLPQNFLILNLLRAHDNVNMPNLSTAQITGIVTLALVLSGAVIIDNLEESYYCETEDNVKECLRLSSSGLTCYYLTAPDITKGDRCTGGVWQPLQGHIAVKEVASLPDNFVVSNNDCLVRGDYCYCNPRGLLDNKRLC